MLLSKDELREIIKESVKCMVLEELGISKEVSCVSDEIWYKINGEYSENKRQAVFKHDIFGIIFTIVVNFFKEGDDVDFGATSYFSDNRMEINICVNDGKIDNSTFTDSLYHEIEHIYQRIKKNKPLIIAKRTDLYDKSIELAKTSDDFLVSSIARAIYMSFKHEQDAYANGLYGLISAEHDKYADITDIVRKSDIYMSLLLISELEEAINNSVNVRKACDKILKKQYGKGIKWFLATMHKCRYNLMRQIGRVTAKAKMDFYDDAETRLVKNAKNIKFGHITKFE